MKIAGDYQYKALTKGFFVQRNWHDNKLNLVDLLGLEDSSKSLVDIGCGSGNFLFRYKDKFRDLSGFDNNTEALDFIAKNIEKEKISNISIIKGDLNQEISSGAFDFAVCMEVIEHFDLAHLESKVFSNIKSFVKPGGLLLITTPNKRSLWPLIEKVLDIIKLTPNMSKDQHFSSFTKKDLRILLGRFGFEVKKIGSFNHLSPFLPVNCLRKLILNIEVQYLKSCGPLLYVLAVRKSEEN